MIRQERIPDGAFEWLFQQSLLVKDRVARLANQAGASILRLYADYAADNRFH